MLRQTFFARPNTVLQHFEAMQLSACEEMFRNMLWRFWLHLAGWFGLPCNPDVTSLSKQPTDHGSGLLCSTPFLSHLAAPINRCRALMSNKLVTNKFIRVWKVHNWLWDPTDSNYINRQRWSGKMHIISELIDWPRKLCCFCRLDWFIFLEHVQ